MKDIKLGKHKLKIYDSIDELPIVRHHKFNKLLLVDANIGSSITDFDARLERIIRYIRNNKNDLAEKELLNLRQNVFFIQTEISPKYLAFAVLIKSIDGKEITDLSEETLKKVVDRISDVSAKLVEDSLDESKKKLESELQTYFPSLFDNAETKEYYDKLKKRILLQMKKITDGISESEEKELSSLTDEIILFSDPAVFSGPQSLEVQQDKQFEDACLMISQNIHTPAKNLTTLEFYNALFFIKEQVKIDKKAKK